MGLLLQDMDSMVSTTMDIEREIDGAWSIQDTGASEKREEDQPSSSSRKKQGLLSLEDVQYKVVAIRAKARVEVLESQDRLYATILNSLEM